MEMNFISTSKVTSRSQKTDLYIFYCLQASRQQAFFFFCFFFLLRDLACWKTCSCLSRSSHKTIENLGQWLEIREKWGDEWGSEACKCPLARIRDVNSHFLMPLSIDRDIYKQIHRKWFLDDLTSFTGSSLGVPNTGTLEDWSRHEKFIFLAVIPTYSRLVSMAELLCALQKLLNAPVKSVQWHIFFPATDILYKIEAVKTSTQGSLTALYFSRAELNPVKQYFTELQ